MSAKPASGLSVIVTGAGGGLGKAIASAYLSAGASVAICDVNSERLSGTVSEWASAGHDETRVLALPTDVTDAVAVQALVDAVAVKFGRVDVLVNNAGVLDTFDGAAETTEATWHRVLGVNLTGAFLATSAAVRQMKAQTPAGGSVLNIASLAGQKGFLAGAAYTTSKHGLVGLTKNTAGFYARDGVYCTALLLGSMETNIAEPIMRGELQVNMEGMKRTMEAHPGMSHVPLEDVAKYAVFLTSDRGIAASANGSCVTFARNWPAA